MPQTIPANIFTHVKGPLQPLVGGGAGVMLWDPHLGTALVLLCHHPALHLQAGCCPSGPSFSTCSSHNPRDKTTNDSLIVSLFKYFILLW